MSGRFYRALSQMHRRIEEQIEQASRSPRPDSLRILELKRLKLAIKDRMRRVLEMDPAPGERPLPPDTGRRFRRLSSDA